MICLAKQYDDICSEIEKVKDPTKAMICSMNLSGFGKQPNDYRIFYCAGGLHTRRRTDRHTVLDESYEQCLEAIDHLEPMYDYIADNVASTNRIYVVR